MVQEFTDSKDVQKAMAALKNENDQSKSFAGMGVVAFLAAAIERLAAEIEELKAKK